MRYWLCIETGFGVNKGTVLFSSDGCLKFGAIPVCEIGTDGQKKHFVEVTNKRYEVIKQIKVPNNATNAIMGENILYQKGAIVFRKDSTQVFVDGSCRCVYLCGEPTERDCLRLIVDDTDSFKVQVRDWMERANENLLKLPVSGWKIILVNNSGKFVCYESSMLGEALLNGANSDWVNGLGKKPPCVETDGKFEAAGREIGALVDNKQAQYGDTISAVDDIMAILYPNGVPKEKMRDMLLIVRILDKVCRLTSSNGKGGESPFNDISGYGLLGAKHVKNGGKENE